MATASLGETGVDVNTAVAMGFADGAVATAQCSLTAPLPGTARVVGRRGWIDVSAPHHCPESLTIRHFDASAGTVTRDIVELPVGGDGLRYQVHEVHRHLRSGAQQSATMSWQHSIDLLSVLDCARSQIGLDYPSLARS